MSAIASVVYYLLWFFVLLLFLRLIMEYVFMFSRSYRPSGRMLIVLEATYTVTDPPLKLLRRVIPPLRVGNVALDVGFMVLTFVLFILINIVAGLR
ncbi:MAG: YggT family protein [Mycobacteriales bacterium]